MFSRHRNSSGIEECTNIYALLVQYTKDLFKQLDTAMRQTSSSPLSSLTSSALEKLTLSVTGIWVETVSIVAAADGSINEVPKVLAIARANASPLGGSGADFDGRTGNCDGKLRSSPFRRSLLKAPATCTEAGCVCTIKVLVLTADTTPLSAAAIAASASRFLSLFLCARGSIPRALLHFIQHGIYIMIME